MSNNDILTAVEFDATPPHPEILNRIEACRSRFSVPKGAFRILDWGCGRGKLVLWLREQGYDAVGVDIDRRPFTNGADLFTAKGHSIDKCLHALDEAGRAPFPDSGFHFIVSWQTLEHIADLRRVVQELYRLTTDGGEGFHVFPPHRRIVEAHLFMPFVHWLPKNRLRRWLIGLFVITGIDPDWWPDERKSLAHKIEVYYRYSVAETFYRSPRQIHSCFSARRFEAEFSDVEGWGKGRQWLQRWFSLGPSSNIIKTWYMNFGQNLGLATRLIKSTT